MKLSPAEWTTAFGNLTSHPAAFIVVMLYGVGWYVFKRIRANMKAKAA